MTEKKKKNTKPEINILDKINADNGLSLKTGPQMLPVIVLKASLINGKNAAQIQMI